MILVCLWYRILTPVRSDRKSPNLYCILKTCQEISNSFSSCINLYSFSLVSVTEMIFFTGQTRLVYLTEDSTHIWTLHTLDPSNTPSYKFDIDLIPVSVTGSEWGIWTGQLPWKNRYRMIISRVDK